MRNNNVIFLITLLLISQINTLSLKKVLNQLHNERTLDDYKDTVFIKKEVDDEKTKKLQLPLNTIIKKKF